MSLFDRKHLVTQADALPGRNTPMPVATLHAVKQHSMTNVPDGMEIAYFAMGCFWGVERLFWSLPGVYSTAAGYTGGYTPNPTYREVCSGGTGHAEAGRIVVGGLRGHHFDGATGQPKEERPHGVGAPPVDQIF